MHAISRFPVPAPEQLPDDIRARLLKVQEKIRIRPERVPGAGALAG
jgi:hypothetical protein